MLGPDVASSKPTCRLELKSYSENQDYLAEGKTEPHSRSQTLIYHVEDNIWWVKVTLLGTISGLGNLEKQPASKRERREVFQSFIKRIHYKSLPLFADTVTEIILGECAETTDLQVEFILDETTKSAKKTGPPLRCRFPSFQKINNDELTGVTEIKDGVFWVNNNGMRYVPKIVNRPFYQPRDTEVIRREQENLKEFTGVPNIVQATGVAVSTNPYKTSRGSDGPLFITGILLEAYAGGSLQQVLNEHRLAEYPWKQWAGNAVLIDISGIGGITHEWCAPEIRNEISPFDLPFEQRWLNDVWAYGKLLSAIASQAGDGSYAKALSQVADCLMSDFETRMSLLSAISRLEEAVD
ncbi:hypothetical protein P170DRAFT_447531 [Aspergillus steynii IBT 23096]|uniref:Protein kinase domain-containing protein n=1 Tax=Aspergillus steynii IBT 23096 TaxID=1392250 RepID=A0A2I2G401_9EURO|nr:uncharacterized protein P170DRAFT_447531 [Aspergillus steynii IBT 23096]PLB47591.1 hypothetical protein P170DRAFT_447531 [Aspergillus steynii IBT 23096]